MVELNTLDIAALVGWLALVLVVGYLAGRRERDAEDYFLAARTLPWYLIGLSFYASNMSGASFVGLMGAAYEHGMVVFNYEWTAALVLIVFALFILPVFLRTRIATVPEYLEARFDRRARWLYAGFTVLTLLLIDLAGALYAGGVVLGIVFPGLDLWAACAGLAVLAGGYTLVGGLRAVVATDALQAAIMIGGTGALFLYGLDAIGGWEAFKAAVGDEQWRLLRPADDAFLPWPGLAGVLVLGLYYWAMNQYFVQRALAARSLRDGQRGALFGGLLKLPNVFFMVLPGMMALVLLPELESPDQAFPRLAVEVLPAGLRGLILSALIAAVMSSLDSALNAAASLLTMDFIRPLRPRLSGRTLLAVGRGFTLLLIGIAALYAPLIREFGSLFTYFQATLAYLVPPFVAVYLAGLFSKRVHADAAFVGLAIGLSAGTAGFILQEVTGGWAALGLPPIHFSYVAVLLLVLTLGVVGASSARAGADARHGAAVYHAGDTGAASRRLAGDIRLQAAALLAVLAATLAAFW